MLLSFESWQELRCKFCFSLPCWSFGDSGITIWTANVRVRTIRRSRTVSHRWLLVLNPMVPVATLWRCVSAPHTLPALAIGHHVLPFLTLLANHASCIHPHPSHINTSGLIPAIHKRISCPHQRIKMNMFNLCFQHPTQQPLTQQLVAHHLALPKFRGSRCDNLNCLCLK